MALYVNAPRRRLMLRYTRTSPATASQLWARAQNRRITRRLRHRLGVTSCACEVNYIFKIKSIKMSDNAIKNRVNAIDVSY